MPTPLETKPAIQNALMQAWDCAFGDARVIYLSGPITGGRQLLDGATRSEAVRRNCADLRATAARLRRERNEIVVEPGSLDIPGWSQPDYLALWGDFIERRARLVLFMPGWEYSVGCTSEFLRAHRHGVRTETISGSAIGIDDAIGMIDAAIERILTIKDSDGAGLKAQAAKLRDACAGLEPYKRPASSTTLHEPLRKDKSLDLLASRMNVAQFVSFSPSARGPHQEYARIAGAEPNAGFDNVAFAIDTLLRASPDKSVNVRSYEPSSPQSREFIYGLKDVAEATAAVERLSREGLHTIVNETIDVHDGGVSGVLMGDLLEFSPDDTPRCVEKPGVASLPRGWGLELLATVYGFPIRLEAPLASRLEFSIHPRPRGWKRSNILAWEFSEQPYVPVKPQLRWPNRFSRMLGDKAFGLLVAHHAGLPVPVTTVFTRRVAPFKFGKPTHSGETWIRTAPVEQVPGKFTTHHGWLDPFVLLNAEDPNGDAIASVLSQEGVKQSYSGAVIMGGDGELIIEGKRGEGESLMLGASAPERLPERIEDAVRRLYEQAAAALGIVRFEWVHDEDRAWIVQLHSGITDTTRDSITSLKAKTWQLFDIRLGLEELRKTVAALSPGTGVELRGRVGLTSHFADVIRRANVPARMG
jgi:hypothetical protein